MIILLKFFTFNKLSIVQSINFLFPSFLKIFKNLSYFKPLIGKKAKALNLFFVLK